MLLDKLIEQIIKLNDIDLEKLFIEKPAPQLSQKLKDLYSFFPHMDKKLKRTGITEVIMWKEYIAKHPDGFKRSQFCEYYNRWSKRSDPVMHINHKAGDKMYVDYAGKTLEIVNDTTGEITEIRTRRA